MAERTLAGGKIGDKFDCGSRIITATELDLFCTIGGLRLPIFLMDEAAQALGFKRRLVPGPYLFTVVFGLSGDLLRGHVHIGTDKLKVLGPVFPQEEISLEIEILERKEDPKRGRVFTTWGFSLRNEQGIVVFQGENTCMHQEAKPSGDRELPPCS